MQNWGYMKVVVMCSTEVRDYKCKIGVMKITANQRLGSEGAMTICTHNGNISLEIRIHNNKKSLIIKIIITCMLLHSHYLALSCPHQVNEHSSKDTGQTTYHHIRHFQLLIGEIVSHK